MPLTSIVIICLRIYALNWFVYGVIQVAGLMSSGRGSWGMSGDYSVLWTSLLPLVGGILIWMWSRTIARWVTPRPDSTVQLGGLTAQDLYSFAFVFLGLYFVLTSIPSVINSAYFAAVQAHKEPDAAERSRYYYDLTYYVLTLVAGAICLILAPRFAKKLANAHGKERTVASVQSGTAESGHGGGSTGAV
jgi:hypothetical protein